jgi:uncharacterized membrane protein YraQ (UPF0718 family)
MIELAERASPRRLTSRTWPCLLAAFLAGLALWQPEQALATLAFVVQAMVAISPLVIPGVLISAWVNASGLGGRIADCLEGHRAKTILAAAAVGAVTPVCGVTVLPLMTGLLASGVPLAPVMAFWLASPVTDPAMFAVTAATLGFEFAIAKTVAAFGIGLLGGGATLALSGAAWARQPLRRNAMVAAFGTPACGKAGTVEWAVWRDEARRTRFSREVLALTRLLLLCLGFAFAAEHLMHQLIQPQALSNYVGEESWWAVPLAVFVGAPAYIDGYAALPLTRGLIDHGMSPSAAMAFLVSGSVVSIWGAMAILPVLRAKPFLLYLGVALAGSLLAGWSYGLAA